ncbi:UDP-2,3-diacylglucosamine diphosphatase [Derxia gummosa]|uniref:UDP-2,3-diacylglucosamine diphosphatase n=1 Tax=Derxia gummosa DSM 723 TaxID=1121388 RepID=A0A9U5H1C7_9BURK|nr:UDP-2,3-diacylglucosamine diphosphatase [Derxia gummosa]
MGTSPGCHRRVIGPADHAAVPPETLPTPAHDAVAHYRAVWISDIHLGTSECQAGHLLDFLRSFESDRLYLVGDIIDGWQLRRGFYWHRTHNDVIQKLLRKARKGTRVVYVPGNHDEAARQFIGLAFGDIEIADEAVHETADGRRLWVTHGDLYDGVIQHAKWLAYVGDQAYEFTLQLNRRFNSLRARLGLPYWSLSKYLKHKVKRAVGFITDFEKALAAETRRRGLDGVVCGHIHHAELREIDGVLYANDGDWVESLTALVEHHDGRLEIVDWAALVRAHAAEARRARAGGEAVPALPGVAQPAVREPARVMARLGLDR